MTTTTIDLLNLQDLQTQKTELVERLIIEGKLTLKEGLLLLEKEPVMTPVVPYNPQPPFQPWEPYYYHPSTTCSTSGNDSPVTYTYNIHPHTLTLN